MPTCLAFAMKLAQGQTELSQCPHISDAAGRGGADVLDINLGPATKGGHDMMEYVVTTVQRVVPNTRSPRRMTPRPSGSR